MEGRKNEQRWVEAGQVKKLKLAKRKKAFVGTTISPRRSCGEKECSFEGTEALVAQPVGVRSSWDVPGRRQENKMIRGTFETLAPAQRPPANHNLFAKGRRAGEAIQKRGVDGGAKKVGGTEKILNI